MFRPIRTLLFMISAGLLIWGIFVILFGFAFGGWWVAFIIWALAAFFGWLGRKCPF
jgi:hypothetical protein